MPGGHLSVSRLPSISRICVAKTRNMRSLVLLGMGSLATATSLWSSKAASWDTTNEAFVLGNGKLGGRSISLISKNSLLTQTVMPFGEPGAEKLNLNHDELWDGGPFEIDVSSAEV